MTTHTPVAGASGQVPATAGHRRRIDGDAGYWPYLVPGLLGFLAIVLVPGVMNAGLSLTEWTGVGTPEWTGLDNYRELASDSAFWSSFGHNLALVIAMAVLPTAIGLVLAAILFDVIAKRFRPGTASALRACIYLPQVLPVVVAGIAWTWILAPEGGALNGALAKVGLGGLAQDWLGDPDYALLTVMVITLWIQIGFPLVVFMAALQRVDPALYEAAELDGANWWRRFWHVTMPQIRPETFVVLLWCTIAALKVFVPIFVLTKGGPGGATNVPAYYSYQNFFEKAQVGYGAAVSSVLTLILLALTVVFLRIQGARTDQP